MGTDLSLTWTCVDVSRTLLNPHISTSKIPYIFCCDSHVKLFKWWIYTTSLHYVSDRRHLVGQSWQINTIMAQKKPSQMQHKNVSNQSKTNVFGSFYCTIPFVCRRVCSSLSFWFPAVEPAASVCVCAAASSLSAARPAAERSPAAAKRTGDAAELNHIDQTLSKSQICIPLLWLCWRLDRFKCAETQSKSFYCFNENTVLVVDSQLKVMSKKKSRINAHLTKRLPFYL